MNIDSLKNVSDVKPVEVRQVENVKPVKVETKIENKTKLDTDKNVQEMSDELMKKSVKQANVALKQHHRRIDRSVHEVTKTVMYKMVDTETKEVVKEFPPKKIQDMIAKMWELAGLFVDEKI
ncbi:flagellar protein FlaG [Clostridiaceae bacterium HSG29]|nr:flagellar protein FlaG [Clostridiaceae bacterium HSG29]